MDQDDGVNDFLERVKELGDKRDREDEERARRLEEEILAGREARKARRNERAKSLSPRKDLPGNSLRTSKSAVLNAIDLEQLRTLDSSPSEQRREDAVNDALDRLTGSSSVTKENADPAHCSESDSTPSWKRRADPRETTMSGAMSQSPIESPAPESDIEFRRSLIARNLGNKDVDFFKQSADRKPPSDVLLKGSSENFGSDSRKALPGMRTQKTGPQEDQSTVEPSKNTRNYRAHRATLSVSHPYSSISKHNLFPTSSTMRFDPALAGRDHSVSDDDTRQPAMSPSQGRISPERIGTASPKVIGSFVQSAMLKREGSINKRWSASPGSSGPRTASPTPARSQFVPQSKSHETVSSGLSREASPVTQDPPVTPEIPKREPFNRGRAKSIVESLSKYSTSGMHPSLSDSPKHDVTPPSTPKSHDQKRWSPTKASWLEVALKKGSDSNPPNASKSTAPVEPHRDATLTAPGKQPDTRPAVQPKPANLPSRSILDNAPHLSSTSVALNQVTSSRSTPEKPPLPDKPMFVKQPPKVSEKPSSIVSRPTPGPKVELDFRGNLKTRGSASGLAEKEDLPFLSAMSRLRSTKTQNYVPQNEFKEKIIAGKAALNDTGPISKPKAPDPVKEKLISMKGSLRYSHSTASTASSASNASDLSDKPRPILPTKQISAPARIEDEQPTSLADKRVPNLANLLSRGPPSFKAPREVLSSSPNMPSQSTDELQGGQGGDGPLIHVTKTRARGPKRRQPTKAASGQTNAGPQAIPITSKETGSLNNNLGVNRTPSLSISPPKQSSVAPLEEAALPLPNIPVEVIPNAPKRIPSVGLDASTKTAPISAPKPQLLGVKSEYKPPSVADEPEKIKSKPPTPAKSPLLSAKTDFSYSPATSPIPSPSLENSVNLFSLDVTQNSTLPPVATVLTDTPPERPVQPPALSWLARRATTRTPPTRPAKPLPIPIQEKPTQESSQEVAPQLTHKSSKPSFVEDADKVSELITTQAATTESLSRSGSLRPDPIVRKISYGSILNASNELNSFFRDPEMPSVQIDFEMAHILPSRKPAVDEYETVKFDVWEVTGDGKVQGVEAGKEHILFDENMYMCLHIFEDASGTQGAEFYLWSGNQVSKAAIDDAQIFAQKMAKESDAVMVMLTQGHETPGFLNALGGAIITRRGASKSGGASQYVLCGRSLYNGMAFDEEDSKSPCICSGFPYLIHDGLKLHLWKGKGANSVEIDYARRVAADLSNGDFDEVDEGAEPQAVLDFIKIGQEEKAAAKYWEMKPTCSNYAVRLFKLDVLSAQNVVEISPFNQNDIHLGNIYVLDAFFELYIVVGAQSQSKRGDFQAALQFTQAYSKAAQPLDGRPFSPPTFVLLEGVSKEFRSAFRSWKPAQIPTRFAPSRKPSLKVVELRDAMRAMNMAQ